VQFSPNTSHELWKRTVNATLAMGYQADLAHYYKFHILQQICSTQYFTILFRDWGRRRTARINSWRYRKDSLVKICQDRESRLLDVIINESKLPSMLLVKHVGKILEKFPCVSITAQSFRTRRSHFTHFKGMLHPLQESSFSKWTVVSLNI
jgi:hypothetical protein